MDVRTLEHGSLKVPYEILNKKFRHAQKAIDREVAQTDSYAAALAAMLASGQPNPKAGEVTSLVTSVIADLDGLLQKTQTAVLEEREAAEELLRRVQHLRVGLESVDDMTTRDHWQRTRFARMLVEYFLRCGYYSSAELAATRLGVAQLTNLSVFHAAQVVERSLVQDHDPGPALQWCADNKSKLRRIKSNFELLVRQQEYIELVRGRRCMEAVAYMQKYFNALTREQWGPILPLMGLLCHGPETDNPNYHSLYSEERWTVLVNVFRHENLRLYQLEAQSPFSACIQTGLSMLKTYECAGHSTSPPRPVGEQRRKPSRRRSASEGTDDVPMLSCIVNEPPQNAAAAPRARECPTCVPEARTLAKHLPYAHSSRSRLLCYKSGLKLDENNAPLMLPNGMVYGTKTLLEMTDAEGFVVCPRTRQRYLFVEAVRVYIM